MSNVTVANVEYKAYRIVDICAKQAERLCKQYLSINRKTAILLDFTGSIVGIAQTG